MSTFKNAPFYFKINALMLATGRALKNITPLKGETLPDFEKRMKINMPAVKLALETGMFTLEEFRLYLKATLKSLIEEIISNHNKFYTKNASLRNIMIKNYSTLTTKSNYMRSARAELTKKLIQTFNSSKKLKLIKNINTIRLMRKYGVQGVVSHPIFEKRLREANLENRNRRQTSNNRGKRPRQTSNNPGQTSNNRGQTSNHRG